MKLEAGKYYLTSDGLKVGPMYVSKVPCNDGYLFADVEKASRGWYTVNGKRVFEGKPGDIVFEWVEPKPEWQPWADLSIQAGDEVVSNICKAPSFVVTPSVAKYSYSANNSILWKVVQRKADLKYGEWQEGTTTDPQAKVGYQLPVKPVKGFDKRTVYYEDGASVVEFSTIDGKIDKSVPPKWKV